jgi:regulator of protease activity HflC (stomatin/prohibitin superfamily)
MNVASAVQLLAVLSWIIVIGAVVFIGVTIARGGRAGGLVPLVIGALLLALVLNATASGLVFVPPEQRAVVESALQGGVRPEPLGAGLHWITPVFERPIFYRISRATYTMTSNPLEGQVVGDDSIQARTKDGQQVTIDASVIYEVDPAKVVQLHITWQDRYEDGVVRTVTRSAIRDAVSQFGVEEIVSSKRAELQQAITGQVTKGLANNNLHLVDFLLRNIAFSPEYAAAVEQKQIAEQQAQQAELVVEQRKQEAEQARQVAEGQADAAVIKARGEAEARLVQADAEAKALALIGDALNDNPDLLQYTYVQKLGPDVQVMLVPSNSPYLFNLPQVPGATAVPGTTVPEPAPAAAP